MVGGRWLVVGCWLFPRTLYNRAALINFLVSPFFFKFLDNLPRQKIPYFSCAIFVFFLQSIQHDLIIFPDKRLKREST